MSASPITALSAKSSATPQAEGHPPQRLMLWCMRREVWENRSIYIAPFVAAGLMLLAFLITAIEASIHIREIQPRDGTLAGIESTTALWLPYILIAAPVIVTGLVVAIAYCLGALQSERRDRSILFWKSLPVSDLITVLSKFSVPIVLIPLTSFVAAVILQLVTFTTVLVSVPLIGAKVHLVWAGVPIGYRTIPMLWAGVPIVYLTLALLYAILATALWHAPIYAWLILVGGWARRMTFVWAIAPVTGLMIGERIAFGTNYLEASFVNRLYGGLPIAFTSITDSDLPALAPIQFISNPGLWIGFAFAALFLAAAILMRRYRQPI